MEHDESLLWYLLRSLAHKPDIGPGDPDNQLLQQLATDPVFERLPPGAGSPSIAQTPANYRETPFQGQGAVWDSPTVTLTFESSTPGRLIYEYYSAGLR